jgi:putative inorganic carbon (HCO3(-)) transporter
VLHLVTAFLALLVTGGTLLLTQSRGAMLGLGIALVALFFAWRRRWVVSLVALVGMVFLAGLLLARFPELLGSVDPAESMGTRTTLSSFDFRLTVWRAALQVLQAFPLSGVGIGTFDTIVRLLFPHLYPASPYNPSANITHAHNELLQVAIDLGIPGFVAYVALLAAFVRTAWRAYAWAPDERIKRLILGLGAGMLAHQIFGLTDAFLLGTKPGIVMWMIMGLVTGLYLNLAPEHLAISEHG